ncbi:hypothetical protein KP509_32G001800 [Ceratopteris richardii]|uniref:Uncharacterized protein n=1 Tax=Ceratopteris richardii TaxID=49495 RepID=A0A8T2QQ83_CERRI|nr:hypothetical protein KP509_32G001800 [Ceratopteris richardii]
MGRQKKRVGGLPILLRQKKGEAHLFITYPCIRSERLLYLSLSTLSSLSLGVFVAWKNHL